MNDIFNKILSEIGGPLNVIDMAEIDAICERLAKARTIVTYGCGREELQVRGFAMRLFHLGLNVSVVGDMTCPPVGKGDVFLASSGPGELSTVLALMEQSTKAGGHNIVLTAQGQGTAAKRADTVCLIPAQTMASDSGAGPKSILPMGSVYEGALFVLFEVMVEKIKHLVKATPDTMRARHTNME
jgi:6-phospho-3-hexuloisomerase